ncbi:MAG: ribbon-helix-helix domain-containing protein [Defluviitaleaceae bacterium]|nr:ribbon-helix-helix domain-containing protein [Defluviitaleaceae bacterium]
MSKRGRPTEDKRDRRFETRLSKTTYNMLEDCSKKLEVTKSEVVRRGIELVKAQIK